MTRKIEEKAHGWKTEEKANDGKGRSTYKILRTYKKLLHLITNFRL